MDLIRNVDSNPNTKKLAWWFKLTRQEFFKIKEQSVFLNTPLFSRCNKKEYRVFWNLNFDLIEYKNGNDFYISYFSESDPTEKVIYILKNEQKQHNNINKQRIL